MAHAVAGAASTTPGKRSLAMEGFAAALRALPATICENAGVDAADAVTRLRAAHAADPDGTRAGVDVRAGGVADMGAAGVVEGREEGESWFLFFFFLFSLFWGFTHTPSHPSFL